MIQPVCLPLLQHHIPLHWSLCWLYTVQGAMTLAWLVVALLSLNTFRKVRKVAKNVADACICHSNFTHLVCLAAYKEPLSVLIETIDSIARQTVVGRVVLVVGFEERTPELEAKLSRLRELYQSKFKLLMMTVHPAGLPGEIPGKCSNSNFALRQAEKIIAANGQDMENLLVRA